VWCVRALVVIWGGETSNMTSARVVNSNCGCWQPVAFTCWLFCVLLNEMSATCYSLIGCRTVCTCQPAGVLAAHCMLCCVSTACFKDVAMCLARALLLARVVWWFQPVDGHSDAGPNTGLTPLLDRKPHYRFSLMVVSCSESVTDQWHGSVVIICELTLHDVW